MAGDHTDVKTQVDHRQQADSHGSFFIKVSYQMRASFFIQQPLLVLTVTLQSRGEVTGRRRDNIGGEVYNTYKTSATSSCAVRVGAETRKFQDLLLSGLLLAHYRLPCLQNKNRSFIKKML